MEKKENKNRLGTKTFWYFFITKNYIGIILLLISSVAAYQVYFGRLADFTTKLLERHLSYVSNGLVSLWLVLFWLSLFIILLARTSVMYRQYSYTLHKHALHISHGIFFIKEQIIPYPQITNVDILRPYIYSIFGLVQLNIETGQDIHNSHQRNSAHKLLPPMSKQIAINLAHELMHRAAVQNGYKFDNLDDSSSSKINRRRRKR